MRKPTQFTEEYRRPAVAKALASGNVVQTAGDLDISSKSLHHWIKKYAEPLDLEVASDIKRVCELEWLLAIREGKIEVSRISQTFGG